jgi:hypothetical protein
MELVILSFLAAMGKVWVISRIIGMRRLIRHAKWFDLFFVFGLPMLFFGTFSGAILAVLSGLWFTAMTWFIGIFMPKEKPTLSSSLFRR